jgi:carboxymethylenebutenolidase
LPNWLPFAYALLDGAVPAPGHHFEYRVPAIGIECAEKFQDIHSRLSNDMINYGLPPSKTAKYDIRQKKDD